MFSVNAAVAVVTFLATLPLRDYRLPGTFEEEEGEEGVGENEEGRTA